MHAGRLLLASCLIGLALGASLPLAAQTADQRLVYRGTTDFAKRFPSTVELPVDPQDGRVYATSDLTTSITLHSPTGDRVFGFSKLPAPLVPARFLRGHLILESSKGFIEDATLPPRTRFILVPKAGAPIGLASGIDASNDTLGSARVVRAQGGDPAQDLLTALYVITTRSFEGMKTFLRARSHGPDGTVRMNLEGPAPSFDLGQVAYFNGPSKSLMLITGEVWNIAEGRVKGAIKGVANPWYVENTGAFYTADIGTRLRTWGVTDATTGAIVVGGSQARELIIQRLELDTQWNARRVELGRGFVPMEGPFAPEKTTDKRREALRPRSSQFDGGGDRMPRLVFGEPKTRNSWEWGPRLGEKVPVTLHPFTSSAQWTFMPSVSGLVHLGGVVHVPDQRRLVYLSLLLDPKSQAELPLVLGYTALDSNANMEGTNMSPSRPDLLAEFPASEDGSRIGLRLVGPWAYNLGTGAFVLDRATGQLGPVPKDQPRAKAPEAKAPALMAAPGPAESPAALAERRAAEEKAAIKLLDRHLEAYNTKNLEALTALYDKGFEAQVQGKSKKYRDLKLPSYDSYNRTVILNSYAEDFKKSPQSRVKVLTRKVIRDVVGILSVLETRVAADDSKEPPLFLELRIAAYSFRDGLLVSGTYYHRQ
jgi:hypothetical protein